MVIFISSGLASTGVMPTTLAALDQPIAADPSESVVLDLLFGLRGGIPLYGKQFPPPSLLIATADGHPRAIAYTSFVPATTRNAIAGHPFYAPARASAIGDPAGPQRNTAGNQVTAAQAAAARRDVSSLHIGWVLI